MAKKDDELKDVKDRLANDARAGSGRVASDGTLIQDDITSGALPPTGPCGTP